MHLLPIGSNIDQIPGNLKLHFKENSQIRSQYLLCCATKFAAANFNLEKGDSMINTIVNIPPEGTMFYKYSK